MRISWTVGLVLAALTGFAAWIGAPSQAASPGFGEAKVRLYSDGEVVGEWTAVGPGRVEGSTFVFPVRKGARELEVRLGGTFSLEQQP